MNQDRLSGRFALITGGSRGIGRAVAECFAREGATVGINHFRDGREAEAAREKCSVVSRESGHGERIHLVIEADVSSPSAADAMIAQAAAAWGRMDVLVNNAGIQSPTPGDGEDVEALERIIAVNLLGAAH